MMSSTLNNIIVKDITFKERQYSTKALLCLTDYIGLLPPVVPCYRSYMKVCRCIFAMSFLGSQIKSDEFDFCAWILRRCHHASIR